MTEVPANWSDCSLAEVAASGAPIIYGILQPGPDIPEGIPYVRPTEIEGTSIKIEALRRTSFDIAKRYGRSSLFSGDVLLSIVGTIGKVAIVPQELHGGNITQSSCRIRANYEMIDNRFLASFLRSPAAISQYNGFTLGTAVPRLNLEDVRRIRIPVPPQSEQRRIVAKIDSLSAKAKRARDHLNRSIILVNRYKETLISSVLSRFNVSNEAKLEQVCRSITDGDHQAPPKSEGGIPFITISALNDGLICLDKATRHVPLTYYNSLKPARTPKSGDVLFSVTGSIGLSALVVSDEPFVFQRHIAILKPDPSLIRNEFLLVNLRSMSVRLQMLACATGTAQLTVPLSGLRSFSIPLPSLQEQDLAIARIKTAFAWIDRLASEASSARKLIDQLDQAILSKAFRGELVPQDPDDEPASVLLERIKTEKGGVTPARRGRGRPRLSTAT